MTTSNPHIKRNETGKEKKTPTVIYTPSPRLSFPGPTSPDSLHGDEPVVFGPDHFATSHNFQSRGGNKPAGCGGNGKREGDVGAETMALSYSPVPQQAEFKTRLPIVQCTPAQICHNPTFRVAKRHKRQSIEKWTLRGLVDPAQRAQGMVICHDTLLVDWC